MGRRSEFPGLFFTNLKKFKISNWQVSRQSPSDPNFITVIFQIFLPPKKQKCLSNLSENQQKTEKPHW
jgi:hypothetical protein